MMQTHRQPWIVLAAALLAAACWGCQPEQPDETALDPPGPSGNNDPAAGTPTEDPAVPEEIPPEPPTQETIPRVVMTEEQLRACLVRQDDMMPDGQLSDLSGTPQPLSGLWGEKATVICFWRSGETQAGALRAVEILGDLQGLADAHSDDGVQVIGINEGDSPEIVTERMTEAGATFLRLLDPEGAYFEKIATETLPRVYLIDAEGKVRWFDTEFSLASRRILERSVQVLLNGT